MAMYFKKERDPKETSFTLTKSVYWRKPTDHVLFIFSLSKNGL